jgi:hypothetical protein
VEYSLGRHKAEQAIPPGWTKSHSTVAHYFTSVNPRNRSRVLIVAEHRTTQSLE